MTDKPQQLSDMRRSYELDSLEESQMHANPFEQFAEWFEQAQAFNLTEPNAMVIATVDPEGCPNTRTVLLKSFDSKGFVFFTNYTSHKAKEIAQNPNVALQFLWLDMERQLKIRGKAEKISIKESMEYFFSRPKGSQLGAWVSHQSEVVSNKSILLNQFHKISEKFKAGQVEFPDFWGGYRVVPQYFEFWQGGKDRLHDRIVYQPNKNSNNSDSQVTWNITRLAP